MEKLQQVCHYIAQKYYDAGYQMTVRQLYYQLVSKALIPNNLNSYQRVVRALKDARLKGWFDMELIVDRARTVGKMSDSFELDVDKGMKAAADIISDVPGNVIFSDRWLGQTTNVSVWVEKEALAGIFERVCSRYHVSFFACKGYPSISSLWDWIKKLLKSFKASKALAHRMMLKPFRVAEILYFGDHDPDGWQIPRSALDTIKSSLRLDR